MRHGLRYWVKNVGLPPDRREDLSKNLLAKLIYEERLNLTKSKAEWVKNKLDRLIDYAKRPMTPERYAHLTNKVDFPSLTIQKLLGPLLARYSERNGEYTRIIRYGTRGQGTNQAQLSYIELMDHKLDSTYALALHRMPKTLELIQKTEKKLFTREDYTTTNLSTGEKTLVQVYNVRRDLSNPQVNCYKRWLERYNKQLETYKTAIESYKKARINEEEHAKRYNESREALYRETLIALQKKVDKELSDNNSCSEDLLKEINLSGAALDQNKVVLAKSEQITAFETGEYPSPFSVTYHNHWKRLLPERRTRYYLNPKNVRFKTPRKFEKTYIVKKARFPEPKVEIDKTELRALKKNLCRKQWFEKNLNLATRNLEKRYIQNKNTTTSAN